MNKITSEAITEVISICLIAIMVTFLLISAMQNRDLKEQIANENKELNRTCLIQQNKNIIEMACKVLDKNYAKTY